MCPHGTAVPQLPPQMLRGRGHSPRRVYPEGCWGSAFPWQNQNHRERDEMDRCRVCVRRPLRSVCDDPAA